MNSAGLSNIVFLALIIGVFYFLIIRPQQKRAAKQREMLSALKAGDEVVTIGGIYAEIVEVGERIRVRVADGSELELAKQAIGQVVPAGERPADEPEMDSAEASTDDVPTDEDEAAAPDEFADVDENDGTL